MFPRAWRCRRGLVRARFHSQLTLTRGSISARQACRRQELPGVCDLRPAGMSPVLSRLQQRGEVFEIGGALLDKPNDGIRDDTRQSRYRGMRHKNLVSANWKSGSAFFFVFDQLVQEIHRTLMTARKCHQRLADEISRLRGYFFFCSPSSISFQKPACSCSCSSSAIGSFERKRKSRMVFLCKTRCTRTPSGLRSK